MPDLGGIAGRAGANLVRLGRLGVGRAALTRRAPFWLLIKLAPPLDDTRPLGRLWTRDRVPALIDALRALETAARDRRVAGVVLRLAGAPRRLADAMSLRRAVERVRAAGKPVAAYGERIGLAEFWVASGADRLWLPETGSLHLVGLRREGLFLGRLLEQLHVRPDVVRVGSYKTAAETFTRTGMSPEQREQVEAYLDDLYTELVQAVARGRALEPDAVRERIDAGPYGAPAAVASGLADGCLFPDEVEERLAEWVPESRSRGDGAARARLVDVSLYEALHVSDPGWRPLWRDLPHVAYVAVGGVIRRRAGLLGISVESVRILCERLRRDARVRAVVLRITSPGGDALASDLLWRALRVLRREKPVVVSMGEVAASGGYLAAVAADSLLAEAATLTGSIGVVGGKLNLEGLYERLGIGRDAVERGRRAGMLADSRGFTEDERAAMRRELDSVYEIFLRRVEEGRPLSRADVERAAQGRVFSGARAHALGLVDALGGPLEALREARARAGIAEGQRAIVDVLPRRLPLEGLRGLLGMGVRIR
jgi:protease IV